MREHIAASRKEARAALERAFAVKIKAVLVDGCPRTEREVDVVAVDDRFEVRWRWRFPNQVSPASIAAEPSDGAVVTFLTHGPASVGPIEIADRAVGVLRLDGKGRLTWARVLATGYQRVPHHVAVEPGGAGRIAVGMQNRIKLDGPQGSVRRGLRLHVLSPKGEVIADIVRAWQGISGLAWTG